MVDDESLNVSGTTRHEYTYIYRTPVLEAVCQNGRGRVLNYLSHILGGVS